MEDKGFIMVAIYNCIIIVAIVLIWIFAHTAWGLVLIIAMGNYTSDEDEKKENETNK